MAVSSADFWRLLGESRLVAPDLLREKQQAFGQMKGVASSDSSQIVAEWLIAEGVITRYQSKLLRAGRNGPFYYGDYKIHDRHESGRLEGLFSAFHVPSGHPVSLQFLSGPSTENPKLWANLARQAEQLRGNVHPQVMRLFELIDLATFKFAVLESLPGESLQKVLSGRPLPVPEACRIARHAAMGLAHLHGRGQTHGEVRPHNIWIEQRGNAKILTVPLSSAFLTQPGRFNLSAPDPEGRTLAAADYLAPELGRAGAAANHLSDVYALGAALYEMLCGRPPFAGGSAAEKLQRHATEAIAPLDSFGVPQPLFQVITYMMAKDPALRFQQTAMLVEALAPYVDPAALQPPASPAPASLGVLENQLQQRRVAMTQAASQPEPAPDVDFSFSGSASSHRASASPSSGPAINIDVTAGGGDQSKPAPSSTLARARKDGPAPKTLAVYFGAGVMAIVAVVILAKVLGGPGGGDDPSRVAQGSKSGGSKSGDGVTKTGTTSPKSRGPKSTRPNGGEPLTTDRGEQPVDWQTEVKIPDDGETLWASPTAGPPIDLKYLPTGSQVFISLRPAELIAHDEGEKLVAALGPFGASSVAWLKSTTGFEPIDIGHLVIGLRTGKGGEPEASLVVRLREAATAEQLISKWNNPRASAYRESFYYNGAGYSYYIPPGSGNRVFAVTPPNTVRELIDQGDAPPLLSRDMENMFEGTDSTRHCTILFAPHYLFGDGQKLFSGPGEMLRQPLFMFLGDDEIKAALVSMHLDERMFLEMRVRGALEVPPHDLAERFQARMVDVPGKIETYIATLETHPYGRQVLNRFPGMIRFLNRNTRIGAGLEQAILRAYQPAVAAHNLLMGVELTLAQQGGGGGPVVAVKQPGGGDGPKTPAEALNKITSLSFGRDTLEVSLQLLSDDIGVDIIILGNDLKLDGITKNQSFGIDLKDQPAKKILEQILFLANPDKTVKEINDPNQKLVYVIKPQEPGGKDVILVTTRSEAAKRGDKLPAEFEAAEMKK
jgi:serine/threonine protein kinase